MRRPAVWRGAHRLEEHLDAVDIHYCPCAQRHYDPGSREVLQPEGVVFFDDSDSAARIGCAQQCLRLLVGPTGEIAGLAHDGSRPDVRPG